MSNDFRDLSTQPDFSDDDIAGLILAAFNVEDAFPSETHAKKVDCWSMAEAWRYAKTGECSVTQKEHLIGCPYCEALSAKIRSHLQQAVILEQSSRELDVFRFEIPALAAADELVSSATRDFGTMNLKRTSLRNDLVVELRVGEGDLTTSVFTSPVNIATPDCGYLVTLEKEDGICELFVFPNASGVYSEIYPVDVEKGIEVKAMAVSRAELDQRILGALDYSRKLLRDPRWIRFYDDWLTIDSQKKL